MPVLTEASPPKAEPEGEAESQPMDTNESIPQEPTPAPTAQPRLMITQIMTENFKSYAGKVVLGPFHKSFSCIIGPNGSGKSNVIDSMLFVFGYRAAKIRSKKLSVLIHKSENHKDLKSCTVAVHFQKIVDTGAGVDEYEVVPNSQFVVSRTAHKDNSSSYYLDGKKVNFKECTALLRKAGVDLDHNRFLILQGEVEQIAMMKPKAQTEHEEGMLEYLEDIIGSNQFKESIEELAKKVEELNEERGEKLTRVKAVESEMEELEKPMKEAQEFLKTENEVTKKKNKLYQKYISECNENEAKAQEKRKAVQDGMKEMEEGLKTMALQNKEKIKEHKKLYKQYEKLAEVAEQKKADFAEFERQDVKCREDLKHTREKQKKLVKNLQKEKTKLEGLLKVPGDSEIEIGELEKRKASLEEKLKVEEAKMNDIMASLKTETKGLQAEKEAKETELMGFQKELNEAKSQKTLADSELGRQRKKVEGARSKLEKARTNVKTIAENLVEWQSTIKNLEKEIPEMEIKLEASEKELVEVRRSEGAASSGLKDQTVKVQEARSSMQSAKDRGFLISALMEQKRLGKINGIQGRLGDLGAIDDKYDVAISTACGALDYIVVDTIETGEKCVSFLRQNNIGVATFICLDKIKHLAKNASSKMNTPDNVPRLYDLVRVKEEKFRIAFYYGLGNTLVSKDLEQATKIALQGTKRHRVVTLKGELIESSGTMSGGGKQVSKGRMGCTIVSDVTPQVVAAMETELEQCRVTAGQQRDRLRELEAEVSQLGKKLREAKLAIKKHSMGIKAKTEEGELLKEQIVTFEAELTEAEQETDFKTLEKAVEQADKAYQKVASVTSRIEADVKALHNQIMEIGSSKMKSQQAILDKLTSDIDAASNGITKANVAIKTAKKNIKRCEESLENMEKEEKENAEMVTKIEKEFKRLEEDATKVLEEFKESEIQLKEMEGTLEESKASLAEFQQKEADTKAKQLEVKHELESYDGTIKENQQRIRHWKKELGKLEIHILDRENPETLPEYMPEDLASVDTEDIQYEITVEEEQIAKMTPNLAAIEQYKKKEENYLQRVSEYEALTEKRNEQRRQLEDMRKQRLDMFMRGFSTINDYLKEMYQMITLGGDAELELLDSLDPFSEGIAFSVRPPKKSWKVIANLSGGEKTLSSLSLVFALHQFKPNPLYVMDEIDAALDFKNVSIVGHYIKERTKNAQFIVISLRNNMFELADRLVGIYKTHNCSKTVTVNPRKLAIKNTAEVSG
ncbi:structural maintenance of chromosomes protein 4 isoform X1 [Strongylocentrotus purpuratus]|uniref:Structural maintenance of chromosomes protein n=1 Tax=Strongylocentrotus purpuratus TaxID=7668 RepID=A0A7M7NKW5_STRPU|nr:structural maintenance of chromosomes protein 4 isoform X1 [Strongylocentrotus purpuratus]XP_030837820.1 structural maintenance of chromosomes protein 4 isoform X1 [Strongylocentrotus purpuratus]